MSNLSTRLYRGEAGVNVIGRRMTWFAIAGVALVIALLSIGIKQFHLGVDFEGGNTFKVPASVGTIDVVGKAFDDAGAKVSYKQRVVNVSKGASYDITTALVSPDEATKIRNTVAAKFHIDPTLIDKQTIGKAWGNQILNKSLQGLIVFLIVVMIYLVLRFEWRMAVSAIASLLLNLILTAGIYSLIGFEVSPSTVIGFLTILGFALYDVVVVFDKIQENTRGITASGTQTYAGAANLAVNQTIMRSINTGLVALLPVGGLLFIGAGLLKAGTLKDLSLVLFVGMFIAVVSSIFIAAPVLVELKNREPRILAHNNRVGSRKAAAAAKPAVKSADGATTLSAPVTPKAGARPANKGRRPGGPGKRR